MCTEKPAQVVDVDDDGLSAVVMIEGRAQRTLLLVLGPLAKSVRSGDWLLMHSGVAVERLADDEAAELLDLASEMERLGQAVE
jgi:hydrogenase assembly chaperone HypC/HupF